MQTVSESYVLGIGEGRAVLDAHLRNGVSHAEAIESEIAGLRTLLAQGFDATMRDLFRGQLDFFLRQQKRLALTA